ncbi:ATPase inhibitor subunit zeta [Neorhizobium sp. NCHU2750]|uniref:ATPase inhibitor subunit zeta n=1 Tax=Neorhizobium sp. NCHU2750 TaxID=1825976 RepID=UPI000E71132E|nr:hypothetical protein NCHU2750_18580 [Neorhizobium sp. NCHU2750]
MTNAVRKGACAHEITFAYSQTFEFRAKTLRVKLAGLWAAARLGIPDAEAYAHDLVDASITDGPNADLATKLRHEFDVAGVALSDQELQTRMSDMLTEAFQALKAA